MAPNRFPKGAGGQETNIDIYLTEKNSLKNFTQVLSKVVTYEQVGDYLILWQ